MELADSPDEATFRAEVREWAEKEVPTLPWPEPVDLVDKVPFWQQWQRLLFDAGYGGMSWPKEYGGQAATRSARPSSPRRWTAWAHPSASTPSVRISPARPSSTSGHPRRRNGSFARS